MRPIFVGDRDPSYYPGQSADLDSERLNAVSMIKLDVEGAELGVLKSASIMLDEQRPALYCESFKEHLFDEIEGYLKGKGYYFTGRVFNRTPTYEFWPAEGLGDNGREPVVYDLLTEFSLDLQQGAAVCVKIPSIGHRYLRCHKTLTQLLVVAAE
ncbi:MAG: hypothetical protein ACJA2D_000678 [Pseudohongiellaceae bacterium]